MITSWWYSGWGIRNHFSWLSSKLWVNSGNFSWVDINTSNLWCSLNWSYSWRKTQLFTSVLNSSTWETMLFSLNIISLFTFIVLTMSDYAALTLLWLSPLLQCTSNPHASILLFYNGRQRWQLLLRNGWMSFFVLIWSQILNWICNFSLVFYQFNKVSLAFFHFGWCDMFRVLFSCCFDCEALWSFELFVLWFRKSISDLSKISWKDNCCQQVCWVLVKLVVLFNFKFEILESTG